MAFKEPGFIKQGAEAPMFTLKTLSRGHAEVYLVSTANIFVVLFIYIKNLYTSPG